MRAVQTAQTAADPGRVAQGSAALNADAAPARAATSILDRLEAQHPNAWTELHFTQSIRIARGDDPVRPVHRCAREPGHARRVRPLPDAATRSPRRIPRELEALVQPTGFFRVEGAQPDRHGGGGGRRSMAAKFRATWTTWSNAARRRTQDRQRRARPRIRLAWTAGRSSRAARRQPHRPRQLRQSGSRRSRTRRRVAARRAGRARRTRLILHGRRVCKPKPLCDRCQVRARVPVLQDAGTGRAETARRDEEEGPHDTRRIPRPGR